jgi:hypothetical protein
MPVAIDVALVDPATVADAKQSGCVAGNNREGRGSAEQRQKILTVRTRPRQNKYHLAIVARMISPCQTRRFKPVTGVAFNLQLNAV